MKQAVLDLRLEKLKEYRKEFGAISTPWDSCNPLNLDSKGKIFLNPSHQDYLNFGYFTAKEIADWLKGKPGAIIKSQEHWDELCYMCKTGTFGIAQELRYFNLHPAKYLLAPGQILTKDDKVEVGVGLPNEMQLPPTNDGRPRRMTPEFIKVVEGHIKYLVREDFKRNYSSSPYDLRVSQETRDEIYGFTFALRAMGLETIQQGASNVPKERENFAWWRGMLMDEAHWEFLVENGHGYEPWIKNRKTVGDR